MTTETDVLVIGSGAAGLSAAIEAADAGASVVVLESEGEPGGSSILSGGMIMAAGTDLQRRHGIRDSADAFFHDYLMHTQWKVIPGLARRIADDSASAIGWLARLGVEFYDEVSDAGYDGVPRTHSAVGRGRAVTQSLIDGAVSRGIDIRVGARVTALDADDGRIVGARVDDESVTARATVLATGGFGANPDRVRELMPQTRVAGDWLWYIGSDGARGDAIHLAEEVDAQLTGHGRGVTMLTPNFVRQFESYQPGWLVLVSDQGLRFADETLPYGLMDGLSQVQGGRVFAIFDDAARRDAVPGAPAAYRLQIPSMPNRPSPNWNSELIDRMVGEGVVRSAESIEGLASELGIPGAALEGTLARYNDLVRAGEDVDYRKPAEFLRPVETRPFFGAELRLATVCLTSVGPTIDPDGRVLGSSGYPIPGLFAAGECTGGTLGERYVGTGNSWINCLVFGRAAGRAAAHV